MKIDTICNGCRKKNTTSFLQLTTIIIQNKNSPDLKFDGVKYTLIGLKIFAFVRLSIGCHTLFAFRWHIQCASNHIWITLILCTTFHAKHSTETESNALLWLHLNYRECGTTRLFSFLFSFAFHFSAWQKLHPCDMVYTYAVVRVLMILCASALPPFFHLRQRPPHTYLVLHHYARCFGMNIRAWEWDMYIICMYHGTCGDKLYTD